MKKVMLLCASAILILSGCSSYNFYSVKSDNTDFSKYHTYAWLPSKEAARNKVFDSSIAEEKIIEASNTELNNRG